jgi:aldose 1-epimerase
MPRSRPNASQRASERLSAYLCAPLRPLASTDAENFREFINGAGFRGVGGGRCASACSVERVMQSGRIEAVVLCCVLLASACSPSASEPARSAAAAPGPARAELVKEPFAEIGGQPVERYTLRNAHGIELRVISYGATLTELRLPDRAGHFADVVLGFDRLQDYVQHSPYFGATIGRVANRIAGASFDLAGKRHQLAANNGPNHLHGGNKGWDKVVWSGSPLPTPAGVAVQLSYTSPAGEEGYPGNVTATTVYTLTDSDELEIDMSASTDARTVINMAHHTYWNLAGHGSGPVNEQRLQLFASSYTPATNLIPTGAIVPVQGTPFDFTQPKPIGRDLLASGGTPPGFDHNWVVDGDPDQLRPVARLWDPQSGRVLTLEANQPGVQFYSGNFLDDVSGKGGAQYGRHAGLCLETQKFPNAINVPAWREQVILQPGQTYQHRMRFHFGVE